VDRSIQDPLSFVYDNVVGTCNLLEYARTNYKLDRMVYVSTDEVFGPAPLGVAYTEWDRYKSGNPYAATKAGAEELCLAYHNTYGLPIRIVHGMNLFGERQHPEKFIPSTIRKVLAGEVVTIHADPTCTIPGSRQYLHARNLAHGLWHVLNKGQSGEKYNICGEKETSNLEMAFFIGALLEKQVEYKLVNFHESRPGHDLRYALDGTKMRELGWKAPLDFETSFAKMVQWTVARPEWLHG
jgi:dTDP-glucose 4,6-dehydratase